MTRTLQYFIIVVEHVHVSTLHADLMTYIIIECESPPPYNVHVYVYRSVDLRTTGSTGTRVDLRVPTSTYYVVGTCRDDL